MLELDDIQQILVTRVPALTGRYEFLSFHNQEDARIWLQTILPKVHSAKETAEKLDENQRWVSVAFTERGLKMLGIAEEELQKFPEEFRQGMVHRAGVIGDTGNNAPENWVDNTNSPELCAIIILFARNEEARLKATEEHRKLLETCPGVKMLSGIDLQAIPPFDYAHDHFGYRDRISQPVMKGTGEVPTPGSGDPLEPGEFILGYKAEDGLVSGSTMPQELVKNGTFMAYRRLQEHVGAFRDFLKSNGDTPEEQELIAAKLMGRWRSGAPLTLAPEKDDKELAADYSRNNDFNYKEKDPLGYAVPLGAHIRRMNPRDTAVNMNRRRMIRRGATYGSYLPENMPDDGEDRGIAAFILCASLVRQFEFAQNVWVNDKNFHELKNERDPIIGNQDGTLEYKIPKKPIKKTIRGLPAFTTVRGGGYFFLPGLRALKNLAGLKD